MEGALLNMLFNIVELQLAAIPRNRINPLCPYPTPNFQKFFFPKFIKLTISQMKIFFMEGALLNMFFNIVELQLTAIPRNMINPLFS